jgi:hypothetical protein
MTTVLGRGERSPTAAPLPPEGSLPADVARELVHLLYNDLTLVFGGLELLAREVDQSPALMELIDMTRMGLRAATQHLDQFHHSVPALESDPTDE